MVITCPYYITIGNKRHSINLNKYRNWHYQTSNKLKSLYKAAVSSQLENVRVSSCQLVLTLYKPNKRSIDLDNGLVIHGKFFCDALVELGCIEDDNTDFITQITYKYGGIDRENPRVEIQIS